MTEPVARSLAGTGLPPRLREEYEAVARAFGKSGETRVDRFLARHRPDWQKAVAALPERENRLACESLLTWEATRQYRLACVRETLPFSPLIVGDPGWCDILPRVEAGDTFRPWIITTDLPRFYPLSKVNFNCTSRQMPGAVNQRVFDVPACGGFLISGLQGTDGRPLRPRHRGRRLPGNRGDSPTDRRFSRLPRKAIRRQRQTPASESWRNIPTRIRLTRLMDTMRAAFA